MLEYWNVYRKEQLFYLVWRCVVLCTVVSSTSVSAHETTGYVGLETRLFTNSPLYEEQSDHNASLSAYFDYYHDFDQGSQRVAASLFGRVDSEDEERTHIDIRELYWWKGFNAHEIYLGIRKVSWGVTESVHLVDVINQSDVLENLDGEEKLGQPMVSFVTVQNFGTVEAYILPYFRERTFPGKNGRLRIEEPIGEPLYQSSDAEKHIDYALRWSHYVGVWDFGLSYFDGTDRNPQFVPDARDDVVVSLRPYYTQVEQLGLDIQATIEAWLWKLEYISNKVDGGERSSAAVGGLEYTLFTIAGTNADLGLILEYAFDEENGERRSTAQNDLAFGVRWAFNDIDNSELLAIVSQDLDYSNRFISLEVSRRLNDYWKLEAEFRTFASVENGTLEYALRDDDYVQVEVRRYF